MDVILHGLKFRKYCSRVNWIDIARCISIAIIVYAHTYDESLISDFVHLFHVPVFFVLSGMVWKKSESWKDFLLEILKSLVIPYFVVGFISILVYQVMGGLFSNTRLSFGKCIIGIFYANSRTGLMVWNRPLWFIPCLVIVRILWNSISSIKKELLQYLVVAIVWCIAFATVYSPISKIYLPWEFEVALHALPYFVIGVILNRYTKLCTKTFTDSIPRLVLVICCLLCFGICILIYRSNTGTLSFQYNRYGIYPLFVIGALTGTAMIFGISILIKKIKWLEVVGQNSLAVLLWHKFPVLLFQITGLGKKCVAAPDNGLSISIGISVVVVSILLSLSISLVIKAMGSLLQKYIEKPHIS